MINRIKHFINGVEFVPANKETFVLSAVFPSNFSEWENDFTVENNVVMPQEAYLEMINHLNQKGIGEMPTYTIQINGVNNDFYVDLYSNVRIEGSYMDVSLKKLDDKNSIRSQADNLTFEYLRSIGSITNANMVNIPYVVIPDDIGSKLLNLVIMIFVVGKEIVETTQRVVERVGDLLSGTIPSAGLGVVYPLGNIARFALLLVMDVAKLVLLTIAFIKLIQNAFDLLVPPLREMKAMTVDSLLRIGLNHLGMTYESSIKDEFRRFTVLPVPIDFQSKKFFDLLISEDNRVLNRGYPTSSDTVPTLGSLIDEVCKIFNINPRLENGKMILNPRQMDMPPQLMPLDYNFSNQENKEISKEIDLSEIWNTKILSFQNDSSDLLLFDNPKGLRVEYKTVTDSATTPYTLVKGFKDVRINFSLGTRKKDTKIDVFLKDLAEVADKLLFTSFTSKLKKRDGVLAISQDQFSITKLLYQKSGKQPANYLSKIGANSIYKSYHKVDDSKNNLFMNEKIRVRMDNDIFNSILNYNFVFLKGKNVEITSCEYSPEMATAEITYKERILDWAINLKTIKIYEE